MTLETYRKKRNFKRTPEPAGASHATEGRSYVIQKHAARRLHYDFRLELDGVLLSWAVPKGPSLNPKDRHLAVRVEDHPVEYGEFEGIIPAGEYGGGTVELWDRGTWTPLGDPHQGLRDGVLKFALHGEKLRGEWVLARMERRGAADWLLIKHRDRPADEQPDLHPPDPARLPGARRAAKLPRFVAPERATLVKEAPAGEGWLHEIKYDGYRALARIEGGTVKMFTRRANDWTRPYQAVADDLARLPVEQAMIDGEVVALLPDGRTDFQALQVDLGAGRPDRIFYYAFDLLYLDGCDLTPVPLEERKATLRRLIDRLGSDRVRYSDHVSGQGAAFLEEACRHGLEGIVSKRAGSPYRPGWRGSDWLKMKCTNRQEFIVGGFTDPAGSRTGFGALLLGVEHAGKLRYAGKVGTGFTDRVLQELSQRLRKLEIESSPFEENRERIPQKAHWVRPILVAEVAFAEWTRDGEIRQPSFKGLRHDKPPAEVVAERPAANVPRVTNPDRVFWPADGVTKTELIDYYAWIADRMLPHVRHRPIAMVRCPEGMGDAAGERRPGFFHKHAGKDFRGPFERVKIRESEGMQSYLTITEAGSLAALAQMGVLEIHVWGSRWPDVEHPDLMVLDLDPGPGVGYDRLVEGARTVREVLRLVGLTSFVKTTGGKGLHVVVPLQPAEDWSGVKVFARGVADTMVAYAPDRYLATSAKGRRVGKIFIDYLRNARTATAIAPYSTRAREHPTVAVPLRWEELDGDVRPDTCTIRTLRGRIEGLKSDPWEGFFELTQRITPGMKARLRIR